MAASSNRGLTMKLLSLFLMLSFLLQSNAEAKKRGPLYDPADDYVYEGDEEEFDEEDFNSNEDREVSYSSKKGKNRAAIRLGKKYLKNPPSDLKGKKLADWILRRM